MATIQVRIDDKLKTEADNLFSSLGLDTSTAVRIFIAASLEKRGIPFAVRQEISPLNIPYDRDEYLREAAAYHEAGGFFYTADETLEGMRKAIKEGAESAGRQV